MTNKERILIIEDELSMRTALADSLADAGYRTMVAIDGDQGLERAQLESPDLILLDVMMPGRDGFLVCKELRRVGNVSPVIMLTAKGLVEDRVMGLDVGADDYLVKPFSIRELLARVRALLRRSNPESNTTIDSLKLGAAVVDFKKQTAAIGKKKLNLTSKEFAVLHMLASRAGEPISREEFLDQVWGYASYPTTRTVDNHIAMLRSKFGKKCIETVHGIGYKLGSS